MRRFWQGVRVGEKGQNELLGRRAMDLSQEKGEE
jgi:hypothetical protein